jgi:hypothetical protein
MKESQTKSAILELDNPYAIMALLRLAHGYRSAVLKSENALHKVLMLVDKYNVFDLAASHLYDKIWISVREKLTWDTTPELELLAARKFGAKKMWVSAMSRLVRKIRPDSGVLEVKPCRSVDLDLISPPEWDEYCQNISFD